MSVRVGDVTVATALLFAMVVGVTTAGVAAEPLAGDAAGVESSDDPAADVEIDRELQTAEGEVEVVVRFAPVDRAAIRASEDPVETLKTEAGIARAPLQQYASRRSGVEVERRFWIANAALVTVDTERVAVSELAKIDGVRRLHANFRIDGAGSEGWSPNGSNAPNVSPAGSTEQAGPRTHGDATDGLEQVNATDVWEEYDTRGAGAAVAVLDTGVDVANHSDLELVGWYDAVNGRNDPYDDHGHGTHVTGTVGGETTDAGMHYGVAPEADLLHAKVLNENNWGYWADWIDAMQWATAHEADVDAISMSLGSEEYVSDFIEPVQNAKASGTHVVAAAMNWGAGTSGSPANVYDSFAVGAADSEGNIASFSGGEVVAKHDFGSPDSAWPDEWIVPDVAAPGVDVCSAGLGGGYQCGWDGTSMATPHVAGTVALVQSATPSDLGPDEFQTILETTAWKPDGEPEDQDTRYGHGIVDASAAVGEVANGTIRGTVTDEGTGEAIPGAAISVSNGSTTRKTTSGNDGSFEVDVYPEKTYSVTVSRDGYSSAESEFVVSTSETISYDPGLRGDANISLSVTEAHFGEPVQNATITATNGTTGTYDGVAVDESGTYRVANVSSAHRYDLTVKATGYASNSTDVTDLTANSTSDAGTVLLAGNATISGVLSDRHGKTADGDALPVANATVEVTRNGAADSLTLPNATDANGSFAADVPGIDAKYTVTATASYYEAATLATERLGDNASTTADLQTVGNATLSGTVNATGVRTENATVTATTNASGWNGAAWGNDSADESLAVSVPGTGGNYTVEATSRAFSTTSTTVEDVTTDADFGTLSIHQRARYLGVDDLTAPDEVEEGDEVTVEAKIVNLGTEDWNETVTFRVEGTAHASRNVSLNGTDNASAIANATVTFTHTPDSPGTETYTIATANETKTVTTTVEEAAGGGPALPPPPPGDDPAEAALSIVDHELSTSEIEAGGSITVETTVENTGEAGGTTTLELTADGETADYASVDVDAGGTAVATFEHTLYDPGEYELAVDGEAVGTVTVVESETIDETDETADENASSADAPDGDSIPGFGAGVAAVALVVISVLTAHRTGRP